MALKDGSTPLCIGMVVGGISSGCFTMFLSGLDREKLERQNMIVPINAATMKMIEGDPNIKPRILKTITPSVNNAFREHAARIHELEAQLAEQPLPTAERPALTP